MYLSSFENQGVTASSNYQTQDAYMEVPYERKARVTDVVVCGLAVNWVPSYFNAMYKLISLYGVLVSEMRIAAPYRCRAKRRRPISTEK